MKRPRDLSIRGADNGRLELCSLIRLDDFETPRHNRDLGRSVLDTFAPAELNPLAHQIRAGADAEQRENAAGNLGEIFLPGDDQKQAETDDEGKDQQLKAGYAGVPVRLAQQPAQVD